MCAGSPRLGVLRRLRPARPDRRSMRPAPARPLDAGGGAGPGRFPCSLWFARRSRSPAMPLRHRCGYAAVLPRSLPGSSCPPPQEFPARHEGAGARRSRPRSARFEPVSHKGGVSHRFLAYSSPSRLPDPDHLAVLARPGFVRAAPALPGITRIRLPSAPPPCCDRDSGEGLSPPLEPQRLTAHARLPPCLRRVTSYIDAHRQGRDVDACLAVLATHLGHVTPAHTY